MKVLDSGLSFFVALLLASEFAKRRRESHNDRLFASIGSQTD
jgi:hypothetical protein